ncbi:MAG: nucleoside deaminase [SAR324 cluster bacterium]|nr:nucleoside deaminase [SAR324 cluster bacterium]
MDNSNGSEVNSICRRAAIIRSLQLIGFSTIATLLPNNKVSSTPKESSILLKIQIQKDSIGKAFEMKQIAEDSGDQGYGAIIVKNGDIVGLGPSRVILNNDPTAHAEIEAIRDACRNLKTNDLLGCELYSTSRPCQMCETAGYWANISRFYYGMSIVDGGIPQYSSC